jgi:hypothetical protein
VIFSVATLDADSFPLHFTTARLISIKTTPLREVIPYTRMTFYLFKYRIYVFFQSGDVQVHLWMFQKCEYCTSDKWIDVAPMSAPTTRLLIVSGPHMLTAWSRVISKGYNNSVSHKAQRMLQNPTVYYKILMA